MKAARQAALDARLGRGRGAAAANSGGSGAATGKGGKAQVPKATSSRRPATDSEAGCAPSAASSAPYALPSPPLFLIRDVNQGVSELEATLRQSDKATGTMSDRSTANCPGTCPPCYCPGTCPPFYIINLPSQRHLVEIRSLRSLATGVEAGCVNRGQDRRRKSGNSIWMEQNVVESSCRIV